MKKILIAVPSMDMVAAGFAQSLAALNKVDHCAVSFICGSLIYDARNRLAKQAVEYGVDYVMWFDSDMIFSPDTLKTLLDDLEKYECDVASGLYFRRSSPYSPVAFSKFDVVDGKAVFEDYEGPLTGVHEVEGVGFGCVVMSSQVIFDMFAKYGDCFSPIARVGEDLSFCYRARDLGYKIMLDTNVKCGHVGHVIVTEQLYKAVKEDTP